MEFYPVRNPFRNRKTPTQATLLTIRIIFLLILIAAAIIGYWLWLHNKHVQSEAAPSSASAHAGDKGAGRPTPVIAIKVRRGDIGVYKDGLGSVTPIYTVTVKSRVDGQLMKINYKEGDFVHKDDLLAEIDARPFEVALEQAQGQFGVFLQHVRLAQKG